MVCTPYSSWQHCTACTIDNALDTPDEKSYLLTIFLGCIRIRIRIRWQTSGSFQHCAFPLIYDFSAKVLRYCALPSNALSDICHYMSFVTVTASLGRTRVHTRHEVGTLCALFLKTKRLGKEDKRNSMVCLTLYWRTTFRVSFSSFKYKTGANSNAIDSFRKTRNFRREQRHTSWKTGLARNDGGPFIPVLLKYLNLMVDESNHVRPKMAFTMYCYKFVK